MIEEYSSNLKNVSYKNIGDFDGFVTFTNLKDKESHVRLYNDGIRSKKEFSAVNNIDTGNLYKNMPQDCETHTETVTIQSCWFWIYSDGSTEIIDCYYNTETTTYQTCSGSGGGTTVIEEEEELEEFVIVTTNLDSCSQSIFDELKDFKPMEEIVLQFTEENSQFNWTLETAPESSFEKSANSAETTWINGTENNYITKIGTNYKNSATKLSLARTIIHEALHAYILSYLDSGVQSFSKEFPELWNDLVAKKYGVPNNSLESYQHEEMARNYVDAISGALKEWDNNSQTDQYYEDLAWGGLFGTDVYENSSDLDNNDRDRILEVNNAEDQNLEESKGTPCVTE